MIEKHEHKTDFDVFIGFLCAHTIASPRKHLAQIDRWRGLIAPDRGQLLGYSWDRTIDNFGDKMSESNEVDIRRRSLFGWGASAAVGLAIGGTSGCGGGMDAMAATSPEPAAVPAADAKLCLPAIPLAKDYVALRAQRMAEVTDPVLRDAYAKLAAGPSIRQTGIAAIRNAPSSPAASMVPDGVRAFNIEIPGPAGPIPTRVWMPAETSGPVGVYISTHGGGWNFGNGMAGHDAEEGAHVLDWGCAVVRPDYRVAPEHKFPAAIEDCYATLKYIGQHGAKLGLDSSRIGIGGGCAGGNIGTVCCLLARDNGDVMPAVQYLWSPACDMRNNYQSYVEFWDGYGLRADDADFVTQNYHRSREDGYDWRASPILAPTLKGISPALVWVGEWEILHDETIAYVNRLRDVGVKVDLLVGPQQGHGFLYQYPNTAHAMETRPKIAEIMRRYIGTKS